MPKLNLDKFTLPPIEEPFSISPERAALLDELAKRINENESLKNLMEELDNKYEKVTDENQAEIDERIFELLKTIDLQSLVKGTALDRERFKKQDEVEVREEEENQEEKGQKD